MGDETGWSSAPSTGRCRGRSPYRGGTLDELSSGEVDPDGDIAEDDRLSALLDASKPHRFEDGSGDAIVRGIADTAAPAVKSVAPGEMPEPGQHGRSGVLRRGDGPVFCRLDRLVRPRSQEQDRPRRPPIPPRPSEAQKGESANRNRKIANSSCTESDLTFGVRRRLYRAIDNPRAGDHTTNDIVHVELWVS